MTILCGVALLVRDEDEPEIISAIDAGPRHITVVRRCVDSAELEAAGMSGIANLAVITGREPDLDASLCEQLHAYGMLIVALRPYDPTGDGFAAGYYLSIGADHVVDEGDTPSLVAALEHLSTPPSDDSTPQSTSIAPPYAAPSPSTTRGNASLNDATHNHESRAMRSPSDSARNAPTSTPHSVAHSAAYPGAALPSSTASHTTGTSRPHSSGTSGHTSDGDIDAEFAAFLDSERHPQDPLTPHSLYLSPGSTISAGQHSDEAAAASYPKAPSFPPRRPTRASSTRGFITALGGVLRKKTPTPPPAPPPPTTGTPSADNSNATTHGTQSPKENPHAGRTTPRPEGGKLRPLRQPPTTAQGGPRQGIIIAVWGTNGAPGRTTTAINIAAELAKGGAELGPAATVGLLDADIVAPSIAHSLGLAVDGSSLSALARLRARGTLTPTHLKEVSYAGPKNVKVLTGLTSPHRWREASPSTIHAILNVCRNTWDYTVVDLHAASCDPLDDYHRHTPHRDHVIRQVLEDADGIITLARADALGLHRFADSWEWLDSVGPQGRRIVTVTMAQAERSGHNPQRAIAQALSLTIPGAHISVVPYDTGVLGALLKARPLSGSYKRTARGAYRDIAHRIVTEVGAPHMA